MRLALVFKEDSIEQVASRRSRFGGARRRGGASRAERPIRASRAQTPSRGSSVFRDPSAIPARQRRLGIGRSRDLLQTLDATQQNRAWREGLAIAGSVLGPGLLRGHLTSGAVDAAVMALDAMALVPGDGLLGLQPSRVLTVGYLSSHSPVGRWTVTIHPRDTRPLTAEPLSRLNQFKVRGVVDGQPVKLLAVRYAPDGSTAGDWAARALIGHLVENSLNNPSEKDVELRLVLAVNPGQGILYLDGNRRWRRRTLDGGAVETYPEAIGFDDPGYFSNGELVRSTDFSCNCPSYARLQFSDWRPGGLSSALMQGGATLPASAAFGIYRGDPVEMIARKFGTRLWNHLPERACKHIHATRFALRQPLPEPGDTYSPAHPYWQDPEARAQLDSLISPLSDLDQMEDLFKLQKADQEWHDLDQLPLAFSVADVLGLSNTAESVRIIDQPLFPTPRMFGLMLGPPTVGTIYTADDGLADLLEERPRPPARPLARRSVNPLQAQLVEQPRRLTRFNRTWPTVSPEHADQHVAGDVWSGIGATKESMVFDQSGMMPYLNLVRDPVAVLP